MSKPRATSKPSAITGLRLYNLQSLRLLLGLNENEFKSVVQYSDSYYFSFDKTTTNKVRICVDAKAVLKKALQRLNRQMQRVPLPSYLHGGKKGCSNLTNARQHRGRAVLLCADIKNFFPSIEKSRVEDVFRRRLECSPEVASVLAEICTYQNVLPTGSPISSTVANFVILDLAFRLSKLASTHGAIFTQYVDDIVISGPAHIGQLKPLVKGIIEDCGFVCHPDKLRILSASEEQVVTGVRVNDGIDVTSNYLKTVKGLVSKAEVQTSISESEMRSLMGKVHYIKRLNPGAGRTLQRRLDGVGNAVRVWENGKLA